MTPGLKAPGYATFEAARQQAGYSLRMLWMEYFSLGGMESQFVIETFLDGTGELDDEQTDTLAHALNERFVDMEMNHPVPYMHA